MEIITQVLPSSWIYALGWTVVHSLWQGVLIAALLCLALHFNPGKSSRFRYLLSCGALLSFLGLSLLTFAYHFQKVEETPVFQQVLSTATPTECSSTTEVVVLQSHNFFDNWAIYLNAYLPLIVTLWSIGFLFFSLKMGMGFIFLAQLKKKGIQQLPLIWEKKLKQLSEAFLIQKTIRLAESSITRVPLLTGYFKPIILLPIGVINLLTVEEVEAILAHELAHIARSDFMVNLVFSSIETLFYYHPAVWLMAARIRTERENCCDDLALQHTKKPMVYAKALMKIEQAHRSYSPSSLAMSFSAPKKQLLYRIQRILNQPQTKSNKMEKFIAILSLISVIALLSFSLPTQKDHSSNKQKHLSPASLTCKAPDPVYPAFLLIVQDSTGEKNNSNCRIRTEIDGYKVELEQSNDEVLKLVIDDVLIPPSEYNQHTQLIAKLKTQAVAPPPPPLAPPPPPAPPVPSLPPTPPAAASIHKAMPADNLSPSTPSEEVQVSINAKGEGAFSLYLDDEDEEIFISFVDDKGKKQEIIINEDLVKVGDFINISEAGLHIASEGLSNALSEVDTATIPQEDIEQLIQERMDLNKEIEKLQAEAALLKEKEEQVLERLAGDLPTMDRKETIDDSKFLKSLTKELLQDNLISDPKNFKFSISKKNMKVNKKKVSSAVHKKYLNLYEKENNTTFSKGSKIEISKSSN